MRYLATATLIPLIGCATMALALADPADDINQAIRTFAAAKSVHVEISAPQGSGTEDMVAPNKSSASYTIMGRQIQMVKIGPDRWVKIAGHWKQARSTAALPINSQIDAAVNAVLQQKDVREEYAVSDGGTVTEDAVSAHKYHLVDKDTSRSGDVFVGADHLPLRIVIDMPSGPLTFTYSRYDSVPDISRPI